jgi:hypothetical protein
MATPYLEYELQDGYVHNWLVAGPVETSIDVEAGDTLSEPERKLRIVQDKYSQTSGIKGEPVEWQKVQVDG